MSKPTKAIIFNKYQIKKLIAATHFGWLYEGINIREKEPVAIKFERKVSKFNLLESEAYFLFSLKGFGIPKLISYGKSGLFNVLIEELLGLSLQSIWNSKLYKNKYKLKDVCMIALQCIDRLEYIHTKDVIHRDIKPMNLTVGKENANVIYLIDFGFAHKYRSSRTGKHIKYKNIKKVLGSMRYLSINANKGYEQSRRDDLESLGYMLVYLSKNYLPWIEYEKQKINKMKKYKLVCASKIENIPEILCAGLPIEFSEYLKYVKNLEFEQEPNYNYMRKLFLDVLSRYNYQNDFIFSWILNKKTKRGSDTKSLDNKSYSKNNSKKKCGRQNSQKRLYNIIKKSLEKERARSQDDKEVHKILNFDTLEEDKNNMKKISNRIPIDKQIEKKLENIFPIKDINTNIKKPTTLIYQRKKIQNIKIIKKEKKDDKNIININNFKVNNSINNINGNYGIKKMNNNDSKNNFKNIIDVTNLLNKKKLFKSNSNNSLNKFVRKEKNEMQINKKELDIHSTDFKPRNIYKTLRERASINNNKNISNNRSSKEKTQIKKITIVINIKHKNNINEIIQKKNYNQVISNIRIKNTKQNSNNLSQYPFLISNNNNSSFSQKSRNPKNYNKGNNYQRYHLRNISYNNIDENTFKSNGLGYSFEPAKKNSIISFNLSLNENKYRPDIKINKNYNINIINQKKLNSSNNLYNNDIRSFTFGNYYNRYIKSFDYTPISTKEEKDNFYFDYN